MKPIYTIDIETDPFKYERIPQPFAAGLYNGAFYEDFWGRNCIKQMMTVLQNLPAGYVYAHNGGRFDFFYLMEWILGSEMMIIGPRIIKAEFDCVLGKHELRDSFAIMPFALAKLKSGKDDDKKKIEIEKMESGAREANKVEICEYLKMDCVSLWNRVNRFLETFGAQTLTIGTASMRELKKVHTFHNLDTVTDKDIRQNFYYGGRVECFESGILKAKKGKPFKVYDVNSMYPFAMMNYKHPIDEPSGVGNKLLDSTMLLSVTGHNYGAFPTVIKGKLIYDVPYGTFHITRHEFDVAVEYGLFKTERFERCINFDGARTSTLADFVNKFYQLRIDARDAGDEILAMLYKFILNSAAGKFSQNPDNYKEYRITRAEDDMQDSGWMMEAVMHGGKYAVWWKPSKNATRFNVATGASITGASRAILLRAIATARRPMYCDTDSLICEDLPQAKKDASALGAWKLEATCDRVAIAGRKLYALFDKGKCVKQANKGVMVTAEQIESICRGNVEESIRDAPSFKLDGSVNFIKRNVRMTA
jgi:hypothetical protein